MITCLKFIFKPSELNKVISRGPTLTHKNIFEIIDFDNISIIGRYKTTNLALSENNIGGNPYVSTSYYNQQYFESEVNRCGCCFYIGASIVLMMVDIDSNELDTDIKQLILRHIRNNTLESLV